MKVTDQIRERLRSGDNITSAQALAEETGAKVQTVYDIAKRIGFSFRPNTSLVLSASNRRFVQVEAKRHNVTMNDVVNAIVTDARMDAGK